MMIKKTTKKFIYKYFSVNEFLIRTLINNELYFSSPTHYNDPLDCQFNYQLTWGSQAQEDLFSFMEFSDREKTLYTSPKFKLKLNQMLEKSINSKYRAGIGTTCFSEKNNEILLWSHYADGHSGVCLKFDWKIHKSYFQGDKVYYDNEIPVIHCSSTHNLYNELKKAALTKLKCWEYEKEVRSVVKIDMNGKRNLSFNPKSLVGIIWGDKIKDDDVQLIKRITSLHEDFQHVSFYVAKMDREKSTMNIIKQ